MKFLVCGDLHLTDKSPENRIDNYGKTAIRKFRFILDAAKQEKCDIILQPGDFFDSPTPSYYFFSQIVSVLGEYGYDIPIVTCYGQHDMRYRQKDNTALYALKQSFREKIYLLSQDHIHTFEAHYTTTIQGAGFGEDVPKPNPNKFNILITHRMIVDKKLWEGQEGFDYAYDFLDKNKFNLIISGDNHNYFVIEGSGRFLINCGSMMRSTITQVKHEPTLIVFDTDKPYDWYNIDIPIEPSRKVFQLEIIEKNKERDEKLEAFVAGLSEHKEIGLSFGDNLVVYMNANNIDKDVRIIIEEGMR